MTTATRLAARIGVRNTPAAIARRPGKRKLSRCRCAEPTGGDGVHVVSVNKGRALVEMTVDEAKGVCGVDDVRDAKPARVLASAERDVERIRGRAPDLADSALAASAIAMAYEIEVPFNSATSKSMCQARLADSMETLMAMLPPERKRDSIDQLADRRAQRLAARDAAAADMPGS